MSIYTPADIQEARYNIGKKFDQMTGVNPNRGLNDILAILTGPEMLPLLEVLIEEVKKDELRMEIDMRTVTNAVKPSAIFGHSNPNWSDMRELNMIFLIGVQRYMNQKLAVQGHVFLNEVLDALGISRTHVGAITGWLYTNGNRQIDFGAEDYGYLIDENNEFFLTFNTDSEPIHDRF